METIYTPEYVQGLEEKNRRLIEENKILLSNQEKLIEAKDKMREQAQLFYTDLSNLSAFLHYFFQLLRKISPLQADFKQFVSKYELDKIEFSKEDKEKPKDKTKISLTKWAISHSLDIPKIVGDLKEVATKLNSILDDKEILNQVDTIFPALESLYKYIEHVLTDEEKTFIQNYIQKNKALTDGNKAT